MTQFLQERIQPQEVLRLVLVIVLTTGAAYFGVKKFIAPETDELMTKQTNLQRRLAFTEQQIAQQSEAGNLSFLRKQLQAAKAEIQDRGLELEENGTLATAEEETLTSVIEASETKIGKVNEIMGRVGIFVRTSTPGASEGGRRFRKIVGEGKFNAVIRALEGMERLDVLVTGVTLERIPDTDVLKVTLDLGI